MKPIFVSVGWLRPVSVLAITLLLAGSAWARPKYKILHAFGKGKDGAALFSEVALDSAGNLYGVTSGGAFILGPALRSS